MTAYAGRLEAQIYLASAMEIDFEGNVSGPITVTVTSGYWYPYDLIAEINDQLGGTGVVLSDGETPSTGLITIDIWDGGDASWTADLDAVAQEILGFDNASIGDSGPVTAERAMFGVWLPGCSVKFSRHGDGDAGTYQAPIRQTVGPTGTVKTLVSTGHYSMDGIYWEGVPKQRVKPHHTVYDREDFETWWLLTQMGTSAYAAPSAQTRIYWNADNDVDATTYAVGRFLWEPTFDPDTLIAGWVGKYVVRLPRFIVGA